MDAQKFITSLKNLEVPDASHLNANDYDYLFLDLTNKPLTDFWEYFFNNISIADKLTNQELKRYEELCCNGQTLSGKYLEQMGNYFEPFEWDICDDENSSTLCCDDSQELVESLKQQLLLITRRKDHLSVQKMKGQENLYKKRDLVQNLALKLEKSKASIEVTSHHHSKAASNVASTTDKALADFFLFNMENKGAYYLSQLQPLLQQWQSKEEEFSRTVDAYVKKQFAEQDAETIVGQKDTSAFGSIYFGQLDLHLVRGPGEADYLSTIKELNRVSNMLEDCERETAICDIEKVKYKTAMEEALKFMKLIKTKSFTPSALQKQCAELKKLRQAYEQDLNFQLKYLEKQVSNVAQLERMKFISGSYDVKLQRQEYYLAKQAIVVQFLDSQLSRYNFIRVALDIERRKITDALQILIEVNTYLSEKHQLFLNRIHCFSATTRELKKKEEAGAICSELIPVVRLLDSENTPEEELKNKYSVKDVKALMKNLNASVKSSEEQYNCLIYKQMLHVSQLCTLNILMEECLFGKSSHLSTLPASWMSSNLLGRMADMEQKVWEFSQEMVTVIKDYEAKKKTIQSNLHTRAGSFKWTENLMALLKF